MAPVQAALLYDPISAAVAVRHEQLRSVRQASHRRPAASTGRRGAAAWVQRVSGAFLGWLQRGQLDAPEPPTPSVPYPREPSTPWMPSTRR